LYDQALIARIVEWYKGLSDSVRFVDRSYLESLLNKDGVIAVESSHGILTDRYFGFAPHTSYLRTIPNPIWKLISDCGYDGEVIKLATCRAYQIRHGAGPMVTQSEEYGQMMLPDSSKNENRWQGKVRIGPLDLVTMEYAINACGGKNSFDGLAINWIDQIQAIGRWDICKRYEGANPKLFSKNGEHLLVSGLPEKKQLVRQRALTANLFNCQPEITSYDLKNKSRREIIHIISDVLYQKVGVPLKMASFGPTETDKICL
jgi:adenylosuccinate synthase